MPGGAQGLRARSRSGRGPLGRDDARRVHRGEADLRVRLDDPARPRRADVGVDLEDLRDQAEGLDAQPDAGRLAVGGAGLDVGASPRSRRGSGPGRPTTSDRPGAAVARAGLPAEAQCREARSGCRSPTTARSGWSARTSATSSAIVGAGHRTSYLRSGRPRPSRPCSRRPRAPWRCGRARCPRRGPRGRCQPVDRAESTHSRARPKARSAPPTTASMSDGSLTRPLNTSRRVRAPRSRRTPSCHLPTRRDLARRVVIRRLGVISLPLCADSARFRCLFAPTRRDSREPGAARCGPARQCNSTQFWYDPKSKSSRATA